jgi:hypothetical protein
MYEMDLILAPKNPLNTTYFMLAKPPLRPDQTNSSDFGVYSSVTDFARLRGWSTSVPFSTAVR